MRDLIKNLEDRINSQQPLRNRIFDILKEAIIVGYYKPGTKLTEDEIADLFNCSRTPVREALRKLEEIELIKVSAGKGIEVAPINEKLLAQEFEIRKLLEVFAIEKACERITDQEIMQLEQINRNIEWLIENKKYIEATRENIKFHGLIFEYSGNTHLKKIKELLWISLRLSFLASQSEEMEEALEKWDVDRVKEHAQIIKSLKTKDVKLAKKVTEEHITHSYLYCLEYIKLTQNNENS